MVGRDKYVFLLGGEQQAPLRMLSPLLFERVQQAFVAPENWSKLRELVGRRRIAVLRGSPGQGRTATAIRLLMSTGAKTIYDLDARVDLDRLVDQLVRELPDSVVTGSGFVLSQPVDLASVSGRTLRALDDVLDRCDGRLVLTVGRDARLADEDAIGYLVELPDAPDLREVVHRHIEWRLEDRQPERWLSEGSVAAIVDELTSEIDTCERAALLALVISEDIRTGDTIHPEHIRARMARRDLDAFDSWFADLPDLYTRSFVIALGALDGQPYEDVARAAEQLRRRLEPQAPGLAALVEVPSPDRHHHFRHPRRLLLEHVRATTTETGFRRAYGRIPQRCVSYKDGSYARQVISHAWLDHQIQDILLAWLTELVDEPSDPILVQVATTLGVISTFSFHQVLTTVVSGWADSPDPRKREAVAYLLRVPAGDQRLAPAVRGLVNRWLASDDAELRATAVRTMGVGWLSSEPADTVATLRRAARFADWTVIEAIGRSFVDLLEVDAQRFAPGVLSTVLTWFDQRETVEAASLVFLLIAYDLIEDGTSTLEGSPAQWPGLLRLAVGSEPVRDPLVQCWCRTLTEGTDAAIAEQVLDAWAGLAEHNPGALEAFSRLARAIGTADGRGREILLRRARRWCDATTLFPLPAAAAAVQNVLDPGGHPHAGAGSVDPQARAGHHDGAGHVPNP